MTDDISRYFKVVMLMPGTLFRCSDDNEVYILREKTEEKVCTHEWENFTKIFNENEKEFKEKYPGEELVYKSKKELHKFVCIKIYCDICDEL
jgi:hypothetical protein